MSAQENGTTTTTNGATEVKDQIANRLASLSLASSALHADDDLGNIQDVAPPLHVSTTFNYAKDPESLRVTSSYGVSLPQVLAISALLFKLLICLDRSQMIHIPGMSIHDTQHLIPLDLKLSLLLF